VAAKTPKKILLSAGIHDVFSVSDGKTKSLGNFVKAAFAALAKTYGYLSPDQWGRIPEVKNPYQEWSDFLRDSKGIKYGKKSFEQESR